MAVKVCLGRGENQHCCNNWRNKVNADGGACFHRDGFSLARCALRVQAKQKIHDSNRVPFGVINHPTQITEAYRSYRISNYVESTVNWTWQAWHVFHVPNASSCSGTALPFDPSFCSTSSTQIKLQIRLLKNFRCANAWVFWGAAMGLITECVWVGVCVFVCVFETERERGI